MPRKRRSDGTIKAALATLGGTVFVDRLRVRDPQGIRKFLGARRTKATAEDEAQIWQALFALYGIPDEWPDRDRLEWLAGRLAAELFPRCQALAKPRGAPKNPPEKYIELADDFDALASGHSDTARAEHYLKSRGGVVTVGHKAIRTARSLIRAVKNGRKLKKVEP